MALSLAERLERRSIPLPAPEQWRESGVVTRSMEFVRIEALQRRALNLDTVEDVTLLFAQQGAAMKFWPIQSAALIEAALANGLFAPIGVGHGKTLITLALPTALDSKKTVLLVPPALKRQLGVEIAMYARHFQLPVDRIEIVAYSELSSAKKQDILERLAPDLIIADEAHNLRHRSAARTKRFLRYAKEHPECRFAFLSGTMTTRSVIEYAHLIELALRKNSPLPRGYRELKDWAGALDVNPEYVMGAGVLRAFCTEGESVRDGFRRRLVETPGVVATDKGALGTSLLVRKIRPSVPASIVTFMNKVRATWSVGDEELTSALDLARVLRQLACGFYYRWAWPSDAPDYDWLKARAAWNREIRVKLKQSIKGMDSPLLCAQAAEKGTWKSECWAAWRDQKDKRPPPTVPVWVDDFLIQAVTEWSQKIEVPAIIWYEHRALGELIAERTRFPHFGAAADASTSKEKLIVCSIATQGTGKNLQHYSHNLFTSMPPNGTSFEQTVGRTHRPGQEADEVIVDWFGHTEEAESAFDAVLADAEYMQATTGQRQKVLYASRI